MANAFSVYRIPRPPYAPDLEGLVDDKMNVWVSNLDRFLIDFQAQAQLIFNDLNQGRQRIALPFQLPSFTAASLIAGTDPRPAPAGRVVYCANDSAGPCLAVSDGTNWRKLTLGGVIS